MVKLYSIHIGILHDVNQDAGGNITQEDMTGNKTGNWMVFRDDQTTKCLSNYRICCGTYTALTGTDNDGKIMFGSGNIIISTNMADASGIIHIQNKNAGNANILELTSNGWSSRFGTFAGGYSWWGQNIELDNDDYPEGDPLNDTASTNFRTRYTGGAAIGSFQVSPIRDTVGTYQGSRSINAGGTQTTVPQKAMPRVMGWDAYDGRLVLGTRR